MKFTRILLTKNTRKFDEIISSARLSLNEAPQFFNELTVKKKEEVYDKLVKLNRWYMRVIGLDEVKHAQDKVMSIQEELNKTREKRREVETKLNDVNLSRSEIHNEMGKIDKNIDFHKFIELRNQETEILKMILPLGQLCQNYDRAERDLFTSLTNAIKESHQKQRMQIDYTKYIALAFSIAGSALTFIYATLRKENLKHYIDHTLSSNQINTDEIQEVLQSNKKLVGDIKNLIEELAKNNEDCWYIEEAKQFVHENDKTDVSLSPTFHLKDHYGLIVGSLGLMCIILLNSLH